MRVARKAFLGTTAVAAAVLAGCQPKALEQHERRVGRIDYPVLSPSEYDHAGMMQRLRQPVTHKQLFPADAATVLPAANFARLFMRMQFALNGFQFSLPGGPEKLATLGVLSGSAVAFSLTDAMWRKHSIGRYYGVAETNVYYPAASQLDPHAAPDDPKGLYQDYSARAVLARGGSFMVCHNALTYFAAECALRRDRQLTSVLDEFRANMLPGFMIVPSGILAIQLAAENGWKIYPST